MTHRSLSALVCFFSLLISFLPLIAEGQYEVRREDPFARLRSSLRTSQAAACDGHLLGLHCPRSTRIAIDYVFYGRKADTPDDLCPNEQADPLKTNERVRATECSVAAALRVVEARCQGRQRCALLAHPDTFVAPDASDPCKHLRKYVETAFKCHPDVFRSKSTCLEDRLHLVCKKRHRLLIYSAEFVVAKATSSVYCPLMLNKSDVGESKECGKDVTALVSHACHAQCTPTECSLVVRGVELGAENCDHVADNVYLKTVYTCTDERIIQPQRVIDDLTLPPNNCQLRHSEVGDSAASEMPQEDETDGHDSDKKATEDEEDEDDELVSILESEDSALSSDLLASYTDAALKDESGLLLLSVGLASFLVVVSLACLVVVASRRARHSSSTLAMATSGPELMMTTSNVDLENDVDDGVVDVVFRDAAPLPSRVVPPTLNVKVSSSSSSSSSPMSSRLSSFSPTHMLTSRFTPPVPFSDEPGLRQESPISDLSYLNQNNLDEDGSSSNATRYSTINRIHLPRTLTSWQEWS